MGSFIIIPSKGRPGCPTARYLEDIGYPGGYRIIVGSDDDAAQGYLDNFGSDHVEVFDIDEAVASTDMMDAYGASMPHGVSPARNRAAATARAMGLSRVWMFDDDYSSIVLVKSGSPRERVSDGGRLNSLLDEIESFGMMAGIPVVGFGFNSIRNSPDNIKKRGFHVYNGFNLSVSDGDFVPFRGRLFEDGVHTQEILRTGRPDFCFHHLYIEKAGEMYTYNDGAKQDGGLSDAYREMSLDDDERSHLICRNVAYMVMVSPTAAVLTNTRKGLGKVQKASILAPKSIDGRYRRE